VEPLPKFQQMPGLSKPQMLAVLRATRTLLAQSREIGWPDEDPGECTEFIDKMIAHVTAPDSSAPPQFSCIQFAPTGPIQEIAMSNGWHDAYIELASEFDRLEGELGLFRA
jgi:hypothetical protein